MLSLSLLMFAISKQVESFDASADQLWNSIVVFGPGLIGIFVLAFGALPILSEVARLEKSLMRPARMLVVAISSDTFEVEERNSRPPFGPS